MTSEKRNRLLTPDLTPVVLRNPLNPDMAQMRTTLIGSMLETIAYNLNRKNRNCALFELGRTFVSVAGSELPRERDLVAVAVEGSFFPQGWNTPGVPADFYLLKGIVEAFAVHVGLGALLWSVSDGSGWFDHQQATLVAQETGVMGRMGRVAPALLKAFDLKSIVYYAELDITGFLSAPAATSTYSALPRFPAIERDFCFVLEEKVSAGAVAVDIRAVSDLIETVHPFDLYRGEKVGEGKKSVAWSVTLRSTERTLTDQEADGVCRSIIETVSSKHGGVLRS